MQMTLRCPPGFTLVELVVVIAVIALLATCATPSFVAWQRRDQIDARARALMSTLMLARSEAIKRGARVTLCRIGAARTCLAAGKPCDSGQSDWSCGWGLFADRAGTPVLLRMQPPSNGIAIAGASTELSFTPPSSQVIGEFRCFDFILRSSPAASLGARARHCLRLAAGGYV
jgi:type IV fimbrial biogenesis protein FimT